MTTKVGGTRQSQTSMSHFFRPKKRARQVNENEANLVEILDDNASDHHDDEKVVLASTRQADSSSGEGLIEQKSTSQESLKYRDAENDKKICGGVKVDGNVGSVDEGENDNSVNPNDATEQNLLVTEETFNHTQTDSSDGEANANEASRDAPADEAVNPFAVFAFSAPLASQVPRRSNPSLFKVKTSVPSNKPTKKATIKPKQSSANLKSKPKKEWIRMADCSPDEQERIRQKWHSLADANAPLEVRRFQVLVAARLHARCQEPVVRKVMESLRQRLSDDLNAATLAACDANVLANLLSSLQYYNTKAKHLVAAATEIQSRFQGKVPESESLLKQVTGIGPVMADLLAFVNTVEAHTR